MGMAVKSISEFEYLGNGILRVSIFGAFRDSCVKQVDVDFPTFLDFRRFVEHVEDKGSEDAAVGASLQGGDQRSLFESWKSFERDALRQFYGQGQEYRSPGRKEIDRIVDELVIPVMNEAFQERFKTSTIRIEDSCRIGGWD
jgi:hypothetical protein